MLKFITENRKKYKNLNLWCATESQEIQELDESLSKRKYVLKTKEQERDNLEYSLVNLGRKFALEGDGEEDLQLTMNLPEQIDGSDIPF